MNVICICDNTFYIFISIKYNKTVFIFIILYKKFIIIFLMHLSQMEIEEINKFYSLQEI